MADFFPLIESNESFWLVDFELSQIFELNCCRAISFSKLAESFLKAVVTRVYNTYLEAVFFSFPQFRTQPSREHALKNKKDLCGRDMQELETIIYHDRSRLSDKKCTWICGSKNISYLPKSHWKWLILQGQHLEFRIPS